MDLIGKAAAHGFVYEPVSGSADADITALCYDSRKVTEGCLFVCMKGANFDSHNVLKDIAEAGAACAVIEHDCEIPEGMNVIRVADAREALAELSAAWFDFPSEKMVTIGVTGTKGKTTTTHMIRELIEKNGGKAGLIGTNGITIGSTHTPTKNTTPESYEIQETFAKMAEAGCTHAVMEVSSQGLMLHRVGGILYDVAVFTNISPDHIGPNEHKDFDEYLSWKADLFRRCRVALINADDPHAEYIIRNAECDAVYTYSAEKQADFTMKDLRYISDDGFVGLGFRFLSPDRDLAARVGIPGRFNADNALAALAVADILGTSPEVLMTGLEDVRVNGRMEIVYSGNFTVLVDYAHNAVSMEALLSTLREYGPKRLVVVFGCGGNRAKDRRYSMGEIGGKMADLSVITADNSRFEKVEDIIADIRGSIEKTGGRFIEIPDRREAIFHVVREAEPGDMIAVIGKGHEDYQEINGVRHHFLDREVIEEALEARFSGKG